MVKMVPHATGADGKKNAEADVKDNGDGTHTVTIKDGNGNTTTTIVKDGATGAKGRGTPLVPTVRTLKPTLKTTATVLTL